MCDCGREVAKSTSYLLHGEATVPSCGCFRFGENIHNWTGYKEIPGSYFYQVREAAKTKGREFDITIEYLHDLYVKQNKKCRFSGLQIDFGGADLTPNIKGSHRVVTASLDRIDSSKGYVIGNVQWVHKKINKMKGNLSDEEFIYFCTEIGKNNIKCSNAI